MQSPRSTLTCSVTSRSSMSAHLTFTSPDFVKLQADLLSLSQKSKEGRCPKLLAQRLSFTAPTLFSIRR
jgi:hypothetical protein